tara:strand:+ start:38 stop:154 length:117 start_codon:yes stop_codon:yes gene_type:complete
MIKKLILISIVSILLFSCGKKAEPTYDEDKVVLSESTN